MNTEIENLPYDPSDSGYLFWSMLKVFQEGDTEHFKELAGGGEVELVGQLFEASIEAAKELMRLIDWEEGFDGVFAYEFLDTSAPSDLPAQLLYHVTGHDTAMPSIQALVLRYVESQDWPQSGLAKALLLPAAAMPFDPEDKTLGWHELADKYGTWGKHPYFGIADWQYEVASNDSRSGYWTWVYNQIQSWEPEDTAI